MSEDMRVFQFSVFEDIFEISFWWSQTYVRNIRFGYVTHKFGIERQKWTYKRETTFIWHGVHPKARRPGEGARSDAGCLMPTRSRKTDFGLGRRCRLPPSPFHNFGGGIVTRASFFPRNREVSFASQDDSFFHWNREMGLVHKNRWELLRRVLQGAHRVLLHMICFRCNRAKSVESELHETP